MSYEITTTVRKALGAAPEGMCVGISDYASQEIRIIACIAKIERMINSFFDAEIYNPFLINPNTNEKYPNPDGDTHVLAATGMYPELQQIPKWDLVKESKKNMGGWDRRSRGKVANFTLIYGGSANRISTALQIDIKDAEHLLNNYFELFPELKTYVQNTSELAKYQKWVQCPITNRRYFVGESNAHGIDNDGSTARKACNTLQ